MTDVSTDRFTVGVFRDVAWAERGLDALGRHGFRPETLSVIARTTPEVDALIERFLGVAPRHAEVRQLGPTSLAGPLVEALEGDARDFARLGIAATMRRVGFQPHDGMIYERLVLRGGVLVGVSGEARAADALATLHAYGGGNAAIGAWTGRV
jgi:hypothetical protein